MIAVLGEFAAGISPEDPSALASPRDYLSKGCESLKGPERNVRKAVRHAHRDATGPRMDVIVVGASGFGREVLQYVHDAHKNGPGMNIKGFLDDDPAALDLVGKVMGVGVVGDTHAYPIQEQDRFVLSLGDPALRRLLSERLARRGARFLSIVHPTAYVAPTARIGNGCVIGPFANVGSFAQIGDHALLNLYSAAGHDARIGAFSVLSPHSVVNGGASLGDDVFLGTHAAVTPNVRVGARSKIAAGAVVYRDMPDRSLATGNPARAYPMDSAVP